MRNLATYANDAPLQICIWNRRKSLYDFAVRQDKDNLRIRERSPLHHLLDAYSVRSVPLKLSPSGVL